MPFKEFTTESLKCPHILIDKFCLNNLYLDINKKTDGKGTQLVYLLKYLFEGDIKFSNWSELTTEKI